MIHAEAERRSKERNTSVISHFGAIVPSRSLYHLLEIWKARDGPTQHTVEIFL